MCAVHEYQHTYIQMTKHVKGMQKLCKIEELICLLISVFQIVTIDWMIDWLIW